MRRTKTAPVQESGEAPVAREPGEASTAAERGGAERSPEERPQARRRRGVAWRTRSAGATAAGAVGSGALMLARLVMLLATLIALLIGLAIVLRDVDANAGNTIVKGIHEGANFFASAFTGLITFSGHPKRAITVDWGIALLVYLLVGSIISRFIARIGRGGVRVEQNRRAALR
jgi:hypothetical protein